MTTAVALPFLISPAEWLAGSAEAALTRWRELGWKAQAILTLPPLLVLLVWNLHALVFSIRRARNNKERSDERWIPRLGDLQTIHDGLSAIIEHLARARVLCVHTYVISRLPSLREDLGDIIEAIHLGCNPRVRQILLHDIRSIRTAG